MFSLWFFLPLPAAAPAGGAVAAAAGFLRPAHQPDREPRRRGHQEQNDDVG